MLLLVQNTETITDNDFYIRARAVVTMSLLIVGGTSEIGILVCESVSTVLLGFLLQLKSGRYLLVHID